MSVLLLRLAGPMQSWGTSSRFSMREAGREPSKSGVIGLLCAALGRGRHQPIQDLAALRMGVRVDQEGQLLRDYHTAGVDGYLRAEGTIERKNVIISHRYYLADARFLVALEGDDASLLEGAHRALRDPVWPLYLGRKAFPPSEPVWLPDGLRRQGALEEALQRYPWLGPDDHIPPSRLRVMIEDPAGPDARNDQPISFEPRRFGLRHLRTTFYDAPVREEAPCT